MAESIQQRLDRVLDHVKDLGAQAKRIVLSKDDLAELAGGATPESAQTNEPQREVRDYCGVPVKRGEIAQSSYVETQGGPSGDTNFGV